MISFNPKEESPRDLYKLMVGCIVPRPIAFVSTVDSKGVRNLAPFSYFTPVGSEPPTLLFCPAVRGGVGETKDTLRNVIETQEFVVNIVTEEIAAQMNETAAEVAPDVDEFALAGLTALASIDVRPPRVAESPVQMECRLTQIITISDAPGGSSIVIGKIVRFHVREDMIENFKVDPIRLNAIGRMGGPTYCRTVDLFELERPK